MQDERPLTSGQVAELFGVHTVTIGEWADQGKLPHFRTPGGQRRFWRSDIEPLLKPIATETEPAA